MRVRGVGLRDALALRPDAVFSATNSVPAFVSAATRRMPAGEFGPLRAKPLAAWPRRLQIRCALGYCGPG